jgi:hypothetical protein
MLKRLQFNQQSGVLARLLRNAAIHSIFVLTFLPWEGVRYKNLAI